MELLVVIAIIALLMGILMPALNKVREMANQLVCGTSCRGLSTAMMIYAQDYEEELPQAGIGINDSISNTGPAWGYEPGDQGARWYDGDATPAQLFPNNQPTVTASLFLLIKYVDAGAKSYVCPSAGDKEFTPDGVANSPAPSGTDIIDCWDFGKYPANHVSFAYAPGYYAPDGTTAALIAGGVSSVASLPILADRSPWFDPSLQMEVRSANRFKLKLMYGIYNWNGADTSPMFNKAANSTNHKREGQNVAYSDNHVEFERTPLCGEGEDEIYTIGDGYNTNSIYPVRGPTKDDYLPSSYGDTVLLNEHEVPLN